MLKYLILTASLLVSLSANASQCAKHYYNGAEPKILNSKMLAQVSEVCASGFVVMHSGISKTPLWSAEHLTVARLSNKIPRKNSFHAETSLPQGGRAELNDYAKSGYDRGHMSPNADMFDEQSQYESFTLANMIPQDPANNQGMWAGIEASVRKETKSRGELFVITGPMFVGKIKVIGFNRVFVPTYIYKIIYDPKRNEAGAYLVENKDTTAWKAISVSELEQMTNINFLPNVSAQVKQKVMTLPGPEDIHFDNQRNKKEMSSDSLINNLQQLAKTL